MSIERAVTAGQARNVARQWVEEVGRDIPSLLGAFFHGSVINLSDDAPVPPTSDVDIMVVLDTETPAEKIGKFRYRDVLLEVSYLAREAIASPEAVLGNYHLAGSFRKPGVLLDPTGELARIQAVVAPNLARREWVRKRCEHARTNAVRAAESLNEAAPDYDQVTTWLFAAGILTHVLLVAGLKNPTVRRRYTAVREMLDAFGHPEFYLPVLDLLGCRELSRARLSEHLDVLAAVFDAASSTVRTPVFFASDLTPEARPIAIDGSREIIESDHPHDAVFWMVATYCRCLKVLDKDAPAETMQQFRPGLDAWRSDLGIATFVDLRARRDQMLAFLPRLDEMTDTILAANREIEG